MPLRKLTKLSRRRKLKFLKYKFDLERIPKSIGIIMDGNGRYATMRGLSRTNGHKAGAERLVKIAEYCERAGVKNLTVYAFSTENWKRPKTEVMGLMSLLANYLKNWESYIGGTEIRIRVIGDISGFDPAIKAAIKYVEKMTENKTGLSVNIALGYGGRSEIVSATKKLAQKVRDGAISIEDINEDMFSNELYTFDIPDPDLIIRTAGELRLSNFLIWQSSYSEFWFTDKLWPEFMEEDLEQAICDYQSRKRKFGGLLNEDKTEG